MRGRTVAAALAALLLCAAAPARALEPAPIDAGRTALAAGLGLPVHFAAVVGVLSFARWTHQPALTRKEMDLLRAIEPAVRGLGTRHWAAAAEKFPGGRRAERSSAQADPPLARALQRFGQSRLSNREREIVTYVLQGHSTESIARHLDISPGTVKIHRKNIYRKLEISTQAQLFATFLSSLQS